jgi:hypothetical protein
MIAKRILNWAGRYAAPLKDEYYAREQQAINAISERMPGSQGKIIMPRSFSWEDFNRIYKIGAESFWEIRGADRPLTVGANP